MMIPVPLGRPAFDTHLRDLSNHLWGITGVPFGTAGRSPSFTLCPRGFEGRAAKSRSGEENLTRTTGSSRQVGRHGDLIGVVTIFPPVRPICCTRDHPFAVAT